ncbi:hypothetical protein KY290_022025 [Solanum tuberosum]|uniref:Uncharacterized protein n=1 Tax=Solanum tuberosum TaxID=4113 RepID=A0ABQ7V370_SOLTU|nr:hypothetical protein KY290_022025 [Solanum tuberosum]
MAANSSGLENNQTGKLNAGAAKKRPVLSNISNHTTVSARFLIPPNFLLFCHHPPLSDEAANLFLFKEVMQLCLRSLPSMSTSDTIYDVLVDLEYGDKIVNIDTNTCEDLRQRKGLPTDSINRACVLYDLTCLLRVNSKSRNRRVHEEPFDWCTEEAKASREQLLMEVESMKN